MRGTVGLVDVLSSEATGIAAAAAILGRLTRMA